MNNIIETDNVFKDAKQNVRANKSYFTKCYKYDNQIDLKALQDLVGSENTTSTPG